MGDLKVKYCLTSNILANHFTKPLQGYAFRKFRADIKEVMQDTPNIDMGWDRLADTFTPSPQECVKRREGKTETRTKQSQERNPMDHIKSQESNTVVRTVEGSTVHTK